MPYYVALINWTDQGVKHVKDSPNRLAATERLIESWGGRLITFYYTTGRYDAIAVAEAPDDEAVYRFRMMTESYGNVRMEILRAWDPEQASKLLSQATFAITK